MEKQLISHEELVEITGYEHLSKQCEVLDRHGMFYVKDRNGAPKTTWYNFNHPSHLRFEKITAEYDDIELDLSFMD